MRKLLIGIILAMYFVIPAEAMEIIAPEAPASVMDTMPNHTGSFGKAFQELLQNTINRILPELKSAVQISTGIVYSAMLFSLLQTLAEKLSGVIALAGTAVLAAAIFQNANTMIIYAAEAVREICEYEKLLCPVLTTALAAQGGITASTALCAGTMTFLTFLSMLVSRLMIPMVYVFLVFSVAYSATGEEILKKIGDAEKSFLSWLLKALLIVFTTYMNITGVISGTTDLAALKAAKLSISSVVPVVGSILSDASESVLVSIGMLKNAAGIYGILAILAVFMGPFIKVGIQYLLLKVSAALCSLFTNKNLSTLINDFSTAMGLLLAMVATACILALISTVCFMKGIG